MPFTRQTTWVAMTSTSEKRGGDFEIDYRLRPVKALARQEHA